MRIPDFRRIRLFISPELKTLRELRVFLDEELEYTALGIEYTITCESKAPRYLKSVLATVMNNMMIQAQEVSDDIRISFFGQVPTVRRGKATRSRRGTA